MGSSERAKFNNPVISWIDERLPLFTLLQKEYGVFPTPRNFNYFWNFGAIAMFMLVTMIVTGIVLAMNYTANAHLAFDSVERIMRDVNSGWLIRYMHMNGASFFFIAVYIHIFRGLYYGSYKKPRELLWILGVTIFLLMMATAFIGYVLPWGQMSYWGATVITNLFSAIPFVGESIVTFLWGGFSVDNPTLMRFFALHYLLPFVIVAVVFLHIWALHVTGSNNPLGLEPKSEKDTLPFHPYYTMKDSFGLIVFIILYAGFVFFAPDFLGHPDNYIPANPLVTPAHIVPEWYFLPFYAMLRAITFDIAIPFTDIVLVSAKLGGVLVMFGSIALLFVLPWLDSHPLRSARFRPYFRVAVIAFLLNFIFLGYLGALSADAKILGLPVVVFGLLSTGYYYGFFLVILPLLSKYEKGRELPPSIHQAVLKTLAVMVFAGALFAAHGSAQAAGGETVHPPHQHWHFSGMFGTYDRAALQRGLKVYRQVCAACHGLDHVAYRNFEFLGYSEDQVKNIAAEYTVTDGPNDDGEMFQRPARPSDVYVNPYPNKKAAQAANNGALPPDLSLITKARHNGSNYVYAVLTGYEDPPAGVQLLPGQNWNRYMPGHVIAMAAPLSDGIVTYEDGSPETVEQYARDVTEFLTWAADPYMEDRKRTGIKVLFFLIVFAGVMYAYKRKIWSDVH
jgi:ubiquinol-cytochrome c reductase cytochrome b/c1 subunit